MKFGYLFMMIAVAVVIQDRCFAGHKSERPKTATEVKDKKEGRLTRYYATVTGWASAAWRGTKNFFVGTCVGVRDWWRGEKGEPYTGLGEDPVDAEIMMNGGHDRRIWGEKKKTE